MLTIPSITTLRGTLRRAERRAQSLGFSRALEASTWYMARSLYGASQAETRLGNFN